VVVDHLTKYAHFYSLSHHFKASTIFTKFMKTLYKLHVNYNIIVRDKDLISTTNFLTNSFSCFNTQLDHNSSYNPQFDGKNNILNKCLEG
jgi:hypothetical protein